MMLFKTSSNRFQSTIPFAKALESALPKALASLRSSFMRLLWSVRGFKSFSFKLSFSILRKFLLMFFFSLMLSACFPSYINREYTFDKNRENAKDYQESRAYCRYKSREAHIKAANTRKYVDEDYGHELYVNCMEYKGWKLVNYKKERRSGEIPAD